MTSHTQATAALNDGAAMPQFGLGVFQTPPDATERIVRLAVDEGYRLVDTAAMYRNEDGVGKALLGRTDVFVTTKLCRIRTTTGSTRLAGSTATTWCMACPTASWICCRSWSRARCSSSGTTSPVC